MAKIHIVLQGKGGVGKSFIAALLAQYLIQEGKKPLCIDTDPGNATFHGYKGLNVQHVDIMEGEEINPIMFDKVIEMVAGSEDDVIIDNGATSFIPLANYLISTDIPALLQSMGHLLIIHTVITGGQALLDTVGGFSKLITQFPNEARFVVWLNPYWGPVEDEGKEFTEFKAYKQNAKRVAAIIEIPSFQHQTFGRNLSDMLKARLTFDEAVGSPTLPIVTRQRLTMIRRDIYKRLGQLSEVA